MAKRFIRFWSLVACVLALLATGCSATPEQSVFDSKGSGGGGGAAATSGKGSSGSSGAGGEGGVDFTTGTSGSTGSGQQGQIIIQPANVALTVENGQIPTQAFKAILNGADVTPSVTWSYDRPDVGDIQAGSIFLPTGTIGGAGTLTAKLQAAEGSTTVSVTIKKVVNTAGLTPEDMAKFDAPSGPDPALSLLYPYDGTVFPLAVLAPEVQWNGGQAGDLYRLRLVEKYYEYTEYFTTSPPSRHTIAQADWDAFGSSGAGAKSDPVTVTLARSSGGVVYEAKQQTWHIAQGRLKGSVYYWELPDACGGNSNGRILRIKPDSPTPDEFFTPGGCWGCHTVSRDGKKMAAEFNEGNGPLYTLDLSANPVVYGDINPGKPVGNFIFSAFNDKGDKLLANDNTASNPSQATLKIVDAVNATILNPNAMGTGCGEPAWSPDGTKIAGICGLSGGGWVFDASSGGLAVADVAPDGFTVTNVQTIVPQAGGPGRPAYPSFSPGGEWIAFGRPTSGSRSTGNGTLWIVAPDGTGLKKLAIASSDDRSFNPVFAPLRAGGYFWLVFITRRDYGNTLVGANRQQLWITAVDDPPTADDPSHPPFYMRGQENCGKSENAYYALDPCKEIGQDCTSGIDCCNGQCIKDPTTGKYVCGEPPPPGECVQDGNACETKADCCNPAADCVDGFCQPPIPK